MNAMQNLRTVICLVSIIEWYTLCKSKFSHEDWTEMILHARPDPCCHPSLLIVTVATARRLFSSLLSLPLTSPPHLAVDYRLWPSLFICRYYNHRPSPSLLSFALEYIPIPTAIVLSWRLIFTRLFIIGLLIYILCCKGTYYWSIDPRTSARGKLNP